MPRYIADTPDLVRDFDDIDRRLTTLEQSTLTSADPASSTSGTVGATTTAATGTPTVAYGTGGPAGGGTSSGTVPTGGGGGTVADGSITYVKLASDVGSNFDARWVNRTGDTMSGALTVPAFTATGAAALQAGATVTGTLATTALTVSTNATVSGALTVNGTTLTINPSAGNAGIELGSQGISNTPFVDFHSSISSTDYDARIIASGGTASNGAGALQIIAGAGLTLPTIVSATTINNTLTVGGTNLTSLGGALNVTGALGLSSTLTLTGAGASTLGGALTVTGLTTLNGGIGSTATGRTDATYFAWDAASDRIGFSKKTGVAGKLAYANATFAITQYVGQTTISPANAQTDRLTIDVAGLVNVPGNMTVTGTFGVTGATTVGALALTSLTTKDVITGAAGAGVGNLAAATVDTYNIKDFAVTSTKLSAGAIVVASIPNGTANNSRYRFLRYVAATAVSTTKDAAGQSVDNLTTAATTGIARVADSQAYAGFAVKVTAGTYTGADGGAITSGPFYGSGGSDYTGSPGLAPGQYRATVYCKVSSVASAAAVLSVDAHCATAGVVQNDAVQFTVAPSGLSTSYVGYSFPVVLLADTAGTAGLEIRTYFRTAAAADLSISHIVVEQYNGMVVGEVTTAFIANLAVTNAQIADLSAAKITAGTITADITQAGTIRTGPDTGARVLINSGGIYAYTTTGTGSPSVQITNAGAVTITGTINATGGAFTGTVTGGTFRGGIFETAAGNVSTVRVNTSGIQAWDAGGVQTVNLTTAGVLTATGATITGTINATGGAFSGVVTGGTFRGATFETAAGTTSAVRFDSTGFAAYNASSVQTFGVTTAGVLTATGATIGGTINATGGSFTGSISASGLTLTGGTLTAALISASTISATNIISGAAISAGTITTKSLSISAGFSDNVIQNGQFEDESSPGSGLPASWSSQYEVTGSGVNITRDSTTPSSGSFCGSMNLTINSGSAAVSSSVAVSPGDVMAVRVKVLTRTATGPIYVRAFFGASLNFARGSLVAATPTYVITTALNGNTGGSGAGYADLVTAGTTPALTTWYPVEGYVTVPAGATYMRIGLYVWANAGTAWGASFDEVSVRKQLTSATIADGAITTRTMTAGSINGDRITAGTLTASVIGTGTLTAGTKITVGTAGAQRVEIDATAGGEGIRLYNSSNAVVVNLNANTGAGTFTGVINASSGTITGTLTVTGTLSGGTITGATISSGAISGGTISGATITGGVFGTAGVSNARIEISSSFASQINFISAANVITGTVEAGTFGGSNTVNVSCSGGFGLYVVQNVQSNGYMNGLGGVYDNGNRVYSALNAPNAPSMNYGGGTCAITAGNVTWNGFGLVQQLATFTGTHQGWDGSTAYPLAGSSGFPAFYYQGAGTRVGCASGNIIFLQRIDAGAYASVWGGAYTNASSRTIKKDVRALPTTHGVGLVNQMRPVHYVLKDGHGDKHNEGKKRVGFIAEEMRDVLPEVVSNDGAGNVGIDYASITAVLAQAIQELSAEVKALKAAKK